MQETRVSIGRYQCSVCGRVLKASGEMIGRRVQCRCGHQFRIQEECLLSQDVSGVSCADTESSQRHHRSATLDQHTSEAGSDETDDVTRVRNVREAYKAIRQQLSGVVIGQEDVIEQVLIAMFSQGHVLLTGVPGLAKTLLISSISRVLDLQYRRIQFTPDLMPADITGTEVLQEDRVTGRRSFQFVEGPVFSNLVLADEINRSPPRTQAALLEAMQERHVTIGDVTRSLPSPFFVMATRNPIEQEGTYPLPEAQLDRFLFNIVVEYPGREDEFELIRLATSDVKADLKSVLDDQQILQIQQTVRRVPVADHVIAYARDLVQSTRPSQATSPDFIREMVGWGAGPRAGISLVMAAKARAILQGRFHATTEDIRSIALPVLRHRVVTTFRADASGVQRDDVIRMLLEHVKPAPPANTTAPARTRRGDRH